MSEDKGEVQIGLFRSFLSTRITFKLQKSDSIQAGSLGLVPQSAAKSLDKIIKEQTDNGLHVVINPSMQPSLYDVTLNIRQLNYLTGQLESDYKIK